MAVGVEEVLCVFVSSQLCCSMEEGTELRGRLAAHPAVLQAVGRAACCSAGL